ncbi:hypothetical protein N566_13600 [Streptomycetaceae bacterium MP113-05]|nr:hypothetical protein N566_13600 [Streptomycetaceae bacterium MP113-05]
MAAVLATTAVAAALLPSTAATADPAADPAPALRSPSDAAATWMASQLTEDTHAKGDQGLTSDIVLALASTGSGGDAADRATDWLARNADDYIDRGQPGNVFAGGVAKLALVASVEGRDPGDFGGHDLTGLLLDRMQEDGRFRDSPLGQDISNQFTQSLAVLALDRSGDLPEAAGDYLVSTQCTDGGFPLFFKDDPADCTSHTDSTGLGVQALVAADRDAAAEKALDWLEDEQLDGGGFRDNGFGTPPANSNSTALAVQGLTAGGRVTAAAEGVAWLRTVQVGCGAPADDRGAVGYDKPVVNGMALRATAQVVPALAGKSLVRIDGRNAAPGLKPVDCALDDGSSGGSSGDTGGDTGGASSGGDTAGENGSGGGDPAPSPSPGGTSGGTAGDASGSGASGSGGFRPDGGSPAGSLADTGSASLLLGAGSATLLLTGGAVFLLSRPRRRQGI